MNILEMTYRKLWAGSSSGGTNKGKKGDGGELHFLDLELGNRLVVVELTEIVGATFSSLAEVQVMERFQDIG
jgi:hypothetical protein